MLKSSLVMDWWMCSLCVFITDLCFGSAVGKVGGNGILRGHSKNCTWKLRGWWKCCTGETLQWLRVKPFVIRADKFLGGTKVITPAKFFGWNCHSRVVVHDPCPSFFHTAQLGDASVGSVWTADDHMTTTFGSQLALEAFWYDYSSNITWNVLFLHICSFW